MATYTTFIRPADSSGNLIELYVRFQGPIVDPIEVILYQDDVAMASDFAAADSTVFELDLQASKCFRNINEYRVEFVVPDPGDWPGANIQLRAI